MTTRAKNWILRPYLDSAHWTEDESTILLTDTFCVLTSVIIHVVFWISYTIVLIGVIHSAVFFRNCWLKVWPCRCDYRRKHFFDFFVHFAWSCWLCGGWDLLQWLLLSVVAITLAMIRYLHVKAYQKWQQIRFHSSPVSVIINLTWLRDAWLCSLS
jgi:hypothetical protein